MPRTSSCSAPSRLRPAILTALVLGALLVVPASSRATTEDDLAAARALFERNLHAIASKDRAAYLSCYLQSPSLARTGPAGSSMGYADLEHNRDQAWPVVFDAQDLHLTPVEPGVVYGTYRYRVVFEDEEAPQGRRESTGLSERFFVNTGDGWKIAVTTAFDAPPGTPPPPRALVGATLVDGTGAGPVPDAVVVLRDGKIECAGTRADCPVPDGVGTLDVAGKWITPGLIDAHVHFSQTGWADGRPDSLDVRERYPYAQVIAKQAAHPERYFRSYLCSGVTSVFDVGGYPWTLDLPERAENDTLAPRVAAAGPLLSTWDFWLNLPAERQFIYLADEDAARTGVDYLAERGSSAVKVWFIPVQDRPVEEMDAVVMAAGAEAKERGLPLIVHATGLREAKSALRAGARLLVHSVWDRPVDEEFLQLAKKNGAIYCPTLTVPDGYLRMAEAESTKVAPVIDDPNGCVDADTRRKVGESVDYDGPTAEQLERRKQGTAGRAKIGAQNLATVHDAGIPIAMGTDAGNPLTLHGPAVYAEMEAMEAAGLTPMEVLVSATKGGAAAMRRDGELGTVEKGKLADLLVLDADPTASTRAFRKVELVVRGGVVRPVEELKAR